MKKIYGMTILALFLTSQISAFAACGAETRKTIDSLKCNDLEGNAWYEVQVNQMCATKNGNDQQALEFKELRLKSENGPASVENTQARVFAEDQASLISSKMKEGDKEFLLFYQRAGKNGSIKTFAIPSKDKKTIEKVRTEIIPNKGETCNEIVTVSSAWEKV